MFRARNALRVFARRTAEAGAAVDEGVAVISVIDYGAGNLRSVENTLDAIGVEHTLIRDAAGVRSARKIVLPGVGHFGQMMRALDQLDLRGVLKERIAEGVPFFGICLGLQALFSCSDEAPEQTGLGIFPGVVKKFGGDRRVPHMGWNSLRRRRDSRLLEGLPEEPYAYFANSFHAPLVDAASATCNYGIEFTAVIEYRNIFAVQFHPEKSGPVGLQIVRAFVCS
ncbi:MAG TPA: imidazole glycerol phosphate synthase subunit HisH [Bryobacteraceae bacterium]|nr:imidazole glycerol phosphate synthase subunit HisH [Bryobacteraceae bacterium]